VRSTKRKPRRSSAPRPLDTTGAKQGDGEAEKFHTLSWRFVASPPSPVGLEVRDATMVGGADAGADCSGKTIEVEIEAPGSEPAARAEELSPDPAAPPPRAEQKSPPAEPIRRGSPEQYDWEEGFLFMHQELNKRGDPKNPINAVDGWRSDADVARLVAAHVAIDGRQPDLKHTARVIRRRLKEWRAGQAEHNLVQVERN